MSLAKKPADLPQVHRILSRAMLEAGQPAWPPRPHLGGPLPVLSTATQLAIAVDLATSLRVLAVRGEVGLYDLRLATARRVASGESIPRDELDKISQSATKDTTATRISKLAARAALNHLYAAASARNVVGLCVENLAIAGLPDGVDAARDHLQLVDAAILRCELAAILAERKLVSTAPIARVLSRPRGSTKGFALAFAELVGGTYGLCVKVKTRWQWHEGDRATAFAMVPDELMRHVAADIDPSFKASTS